MISQKLWDALALLLLFLLSLTMLFGLVQFISEGRLFEGFSQVTLQIINIVYYVSILLMIIILVMENGSPVRTLAWILFLVYVPIIGFIFYLFFGRNWRKSRIFSRKNTADIIHLQELYLKDNLSRSSSYQASSPLANKLISLLVNNNKAILSTSNSVQIIPDTREAYNLILQSIASAQEHVHVEYFAIANDRVGKEFTDLLKHKAAEGVKIRLIFDAVGCWKLSPRFKHKLGKSGIELYPFLPSPFPTISSRLNYRNHRKLVIIDNESAFLGGLNIGNKYLGLDKYFGYWRDSVLMMKGCSVTSLQAIYLTDWFFVSGQNILSDYLTACREEQFNRVNETATVLPVQIVSSGPDSDWESIMQVYFAGIANATRCVHISSPYLVLNESLLMALKTASLSGVEIKIILPAKADHTIVFWGSRSYYTELLQAGVQIYEYQKGFIHAKVLIVDEEIVSIGTANMDMRSFNQNFELNAMLYDMNLAAEAEKQFGQDLEVSRQITLEEFSHRSIWQRSKESLCRLFSPLL